MPNGAMDPAELRRRVAFAIMCFRFGRDCRTNPPQPEDRVEVDLSTDLARSLERQVLTAAAMTFLQTHPKLPFTWKPTPRLDLFKDLTYRKYHALCWGQLVPQMTLAEAVADSLRGAGAPAAAGRDATRAADARGIETAEDAFAVLVEAAGGGREAFDRSLTELEGVGGQ